MNELVPDYVENIGNFITDWISYHDISIHYLSKQIKIHHFCLGELQRKNVPIITFENIEALSKGTNVPFIDIITYDRNKEYPFFKDRSEANDLLNT